MKNVNSKIYHWQIKFRFNINNLINLRVLSHKYGCIMLRSFLLIKIIFSYIQILNNKDKLINEFNEKKLKN